MTGAVRSNPFDDPDSHLTQREVLQWEILVGALRRRHLSWQEHALLGQLNARARPPIYELEPKGAA
jgi:hypothetical protein